MTEAVLADAQFGVARIFRPFPNFEDVYQGISGDTPIAFPGILDRNAGKPGFDPNLLKGIPVPLGSKVLLWIPTIFQEVAGTVATPVLPYEYSFTFRLRNLRDFRDSEDRSAFHFPKQGLGADGKFVLPASQRGVIYEGARSESGGALSPTIGPVTKSEFSRETISFPSLNKKAALTPAGNAAAYQQGLGSAVGNTIATYNPIWLDCEGDELLIEARRASTEFAENWGFVDTVGPGAEVDFDFSRIYGKGDPKGPFEDVGIYVFTGSNP